MRAARLWLFAVGAAALVVAVVILVQEIIPVRWIGIGVWLAGAVVIHDGIIAPILLGIGLAWRPIVERVGRIPAAVAQIALLLGALVTLVGLPGIIKSAIGSRNPTVLTSDYGLVVAITWVVVVLVALIAVVIGFTQRRRERSGVQRSASAP